MKRTLFHLENESKRGVALIVVLAGGKVAAAGTHEQLLQSCDVYREVYESQTKGGERA